MPKHCQYCQKKLGFFEISGECEDCFVKRRHEETAREIEAQANRRAGRAARGKTLFAVNTDLTAGGAATAEGSSSIEVSWVEGMLSIAWVLSFCAAAVFAFLALIAISDRYGEVEAAFFFLAYSLSLMICGTLLAAVSKIIATLSASRVLLEMIASRPQFTEDQTRQSQRVNPSPNDSSS